MNPLVALKTLCRPCGALTAVAGALMMASCVTPPPIQGPPFGPTAPRYGLNGTESPNYPPNDPRAVKPGENPPKIVRNNTENINIEPPPTTNPPTTNPPTTNPTTSPPPLTNPDPPKPPPAVKEDLPYGVPVVGKRGMVYSPYAPEKGQVDVEGYKRGTRVECPYTGKHFRVP